MRSHLVVKLSIVTSYLAVSNNKNIEPYVFLISPSNLQFLIVVLPAVEIDKPASFYVYASTSISK